MPASEHYVAQPLTREESPLRSCLRPCLFCPRFQQPTRLVGPNLLLALVLGCRVGLSVPQGIEDRAMCARAWRGLLCTAYPCNEVASLDWLVRLLDL
jgi:hypothetical protein